MSALLRRLKILLWSQARRSRSLYLASGWSAEVVLKAKTRFIPSKNGRNMDYIRGAPASFVNTTEEINNFAAVVSEEIAGTISRVGMVCRGFFEGQDPVHSSKIMVGMLTIFRRYQLVLSVLLRRLKTSLLPRVWRSRPVYLALG